MRQSVYKVPDGKLIKIKLWIDQNIIRKVTITGDFFLHPETCLEKIEQTLIGLPLSEGELTAAINSVIHEEQAILIGAGSADITTAILQAE
ncbi:MAG: hypothetical protein KAQ65_06670 [Candidatus Thorarchaeota archaeon]|nr:hypothetical protein [Candidatus Thorarchaeota archaeon]MCK5238565.1 hypothetical protein [Candidatus Thorarchaeota archaeon]